MTQPYDPSMQYVQDWEAVPPSHQQASPNPSSRRSLWVDLTILAAVAVVVGVVGFFVGRGTAGDGTGGDSGGAIAALGGESALQAAYDDCESVDSDNTLSVADGGQSIIIDTGSKYGNPAGMDCVLRELGTPQSIEAQIGRTTALQGVQDADHDGLHYSWSYHPDNGVNMVIEATD